MTPPQYLFVYGTLRRNRHKQNHPFLIACDYLSSAFMCGELYDIDGYPGAIARGTALVKGELYLLQTPETTLSVLDNYEECAEHFPQPQEYIRCEIPVRPSDGNTISAWVYLYNRPLNGLMRIHDGDYLNYLREE